MNNDRKDSNSNAKTPAIVVGGILILLGALFLCNAFFDNELFTMGNFWPLFIMVPGLIFEASYFTYGKAPAILIPGGILTIIGLLFFFEIATGWKFASYTWPIYILAVTAGLFQFYLASGRPRGLLYTVTILAVVAVVSLFILLSGAFLPRKLIVPVILIAAGILIVYRGIKPKK